MKNKHIKTTNPWHLVSCGDKAPDIVNAIIETPKGSKGKFSLDKESGLIKLERILSSPVHYPANYGFVPQTYCKDGDPLGILVLTSVDLPTLCLVEAHVIGVMKAGDYGLTGDTIIATAQNDISFKEVQNINDLPADAIKEVKRFFEEHKKLEKKHVTVEDVMGKLEAWAIINNSMKFYKQSNFSNFFPGGNRNS